MISYKKFIYGTLGLFLTSAFLIMALVFVIDPYFHYRPPMEGVAYKMYNSYYITDGITKQFEYNALITGTSMTENFKNSQMDALFNTTSIKASLPGSSFYDSYRMLVRAFSYNDNISFVIRSLEPSSLCKHHSTLSSQSMPEYLYDDVLVNDVNYLWNKEIFSKGVIRTGLRTVQGIEMTTMDEYLNWEFENTFSKEEVLSNYSRPLNSTALNDGLSSIDKHLIYENVMYNLVQIAQDQPETSFYYFYTPYSILYYDRLFQNNQLLREFEILEYATSLLLDQENITLFSFLDLYDIVSDLNYYKDVTHYSGQVNDLMLDLMYEEKHILTKENYQSHIAELRDFYFKYDYDRIFIKEDSD